MVQIPSKEQVSSVTEELRSRSALPDYLKKVLKTLPDGTHPMTQLSIAIMALQVCLADSGHARTALCQTHVQDTRSRHLTSAGTPVNYHYNSYYFFNTFTIINIIDVIITIIVMCRTRLRATALMSVEHMLGDSIPRTAKLPTIPNWHC